MTQLTDPAARDVFADRRTRLATLFINRNPELLYVLPYAAAYTEARSWWQAAGEPDGELPDFIARELARDAAAQAVTGHQPERSLTLLRWALDANWPIICGTYPMSQVDAPRYWEPAEVETAVATYADPGGRRQQAATFRPG